MPVTTMAQTIHREPAFLRRKQVELRTGLSRSKIYQHDLPARQGWRLPQARSARAARGRLARVGCERMHRHAGEDRQGHCQAVGLKTRMHGCQLTVTGRTATPYDDPHRRRGHRRVSGRTRGTRYRCAHRHQSLVAEVGIARRGGTPDQRSAAHFRPACIWARIAISSMTRHSRSTWLSRNSK